MFSRILIHTEKSRDIIMYGISLMFSILLQTARGILNSDICTAHFSENLNDVFNKKN